MARREKPQLERRHFEFIANTIAGLPSHAPSLRSAQASVANAFADACAGTNAAFDRAKFLAACNPKPAEEGRQ